MRQFPFTSRTKLIQRLTAELRDDVHAGAEPLSANAVASIMNCALWASTLAEEGERVRAVLTLGPPEKHLTESTVAFRDSLPLSPQSLAELSVSFPFGRGSLGVWPVRGQPTIWGFCLDLVPTRWPARSVRKLSKTERLCQPGCAARWTIEILAPGFVVVRDESGVRVLVQPNGDLREFQALQPRPEMWVDFLMLRPPLDSMIDLSRRPQFLGLLRVAARTMRKHMRGGTLAMGPKNGGWLDSVNFGHRVVQGEGWASERLSAFHSWAADLPRDQLIDGMFLPESKEQEELHDTLRLMAGLSAVDGALIMSYDLELIGYGAKLQADPTDVGVREYYPTSDDKGEIISASKLGGTRHLSAVRFVAAHPETVAFVASQDGRFTVFSLDPQSEEVLALRSELLLLEDWPGS